MKEHYSKKNINSNQEPQVVTKDTFDFLQKTLLRFKKSKSRTNSFLDFAYPFISSEHKLTENVLKSVDACGSWLEFRNYFQVDKTKLHNANFCKKDKLCPACAMRRASKQVKKVFDYFNQNEDLKKKYWYYIVLPVKHNVNEDFETVFDRARNGLDTLRKAINNSKHRNTHKSFFSQFDGFLYSFEVTKTKNGWNNHINLLCCSDTEIKGIYKKGKTSVHNDIIRDWAKFTDNESYVHSINKIDVSTEEKLIKNLLEIFKYSLKFQELKNEDLLEVYDKTYRKRLLGGLGSLYNIKLDVSLAGDDVLGDKFLEIVYRYNYQTKEYFEHSRTVKDVEQENESKKKNIKQLVPVHKEKNKVVNVKVFDKNSNLSKNVQIFNYKNITDFEIYAHSLRLYELKKSANYQGW